MIVLFLVVATHFKNLFFVILAWFLISKVPGTFLWAQTCAEKDPKLCEEQIWEGSKPSFLNAVSIDHMPWESLLKKYVSDGWVDYKTWKKHQQDLDVYLKALQEPTRAQIKGWSKQAQMVFYINAYNAYTIKLILNHYPLKSIKEINDGIFQKGPWKVEIVRLGHEIHHLDWLEHEVLRPEFKDPRVHAAINCASKGCPKLQSFAFVPEKLDEQLNGVMGEFVNDSFRNNYEAGKNRAVISKIFKWFEQDFDPPGVKAYLARYAHERIKRLLSNPDLQFDYAYDWSLNERP